MKANVPRAYHSLPQCQRDALVKWEKEVIEQAAQECVDKEEEELQKVWIKLACINLHNMGLDNGRIMEFIGGWKALYRKQYRIKTKAEQDAYLAEQIAFLGEYPEEFINKL